MNKLWAPVINQIIPLKLFLQTSVHYIRTLEVVDKVEILSLQMDFVGATYRTFLIISIPLNNLHVP